MLHSEGPMEIVLAFRTKVSRSCMTLKDLGVKRSGRKSLAEHFLFESASLDFLQTRLDHERGRIGSAQKSKGLMKRLPKQKCETTSKCTTYGKYQARKSRRF